ncbi:unnamed protein product [Caenorhabditis bovis]|uniref:DNA2/NAM7 helicase-like C-terminal domain-containing protein n=1 Tax=Caenorhabditis bovis TaxID=2654633 RepID=A0A8S1F011_9PELO|nr:unnamed protein product [Caenorhabditis bovis]
MDDPDSGTEPILDEPMETSWPTTPSSGILHSDDNPPLEAGVVTDEPENETSAFEVSFTFQPESLPCPTSPAFCGVSEGNAAYHVGNAVDFRNETLKWKSAINNRILPKLVDASPADAIADRNKIAAITQPFAFYRILDNPGGVNMAQPGITPRSTLLMGDVIIALRLSRTEAYDGIAIPAVTLDEVSGENFQMIWNVEEFLLVPRKIKENVLATPIRIPASKGKAILACTGLSTPVRAQPKLLPPRTRIDHLLLTTIFIPLEPSGIFTNPTGKIRGAVYAAKTLTTFPSSEPQLVKSQPPPKHTLDEFNRAMTTFRNSTCRNFRDCQAALQRIMAWAASAATSVQNSDIDKVSYSTKIDSVSRAMGKELLVTFLIKKANGPPPSDGWSSGTKFRLLTEDQAWTGEVLGSELQGAALSITARLNESSANIDNMRSQLENREIMVTTVNPPSDMVQTVLCSDTIMKLDSNSNAARLLKALFGGERITTIIPPSSIGFTTKIGGKETKLMDDQNQFISAISEGNPVMAVSSPFGCGKTLTMAVAAAECAKKDDKLHLSVGITNASVVNLVKAARTVESDAPILRLVSRENYTTMRAEHKTAFDAPRLVDKLFLERAREHDAELALSDVEIANNNELAIVIYHCRRHQLLSSEEIKSAPGKAAWKQSVRNLARESVQIFINLYKPRRLIATATSALSLLTTTWKSLGEIATLQIDEASQLPLTTLVALSASFPNARMALVGDFRQLPPFSHSRSTPMIRSTAVSEPLRALVEKRLVPTVELRHVWRTHPTITTALSDLFYGNSLITKVEARERSNFMTRTPWWPNKEHPILFVHHTHSHTLAGKSLTNTGELKIVKRLTKLIGENIPERDVGVVAFYRAQADRIANALNEVSVTTGTVDAFQGQEREVMIVCLTRTHGDPTDFLLDERRINVAMSRAKQCVILVGNANIIGEAGYWSEIFRTCRYAQTILTESQLPETQ